MLTGYELTVADYIALGTAAAMVLFCLVEFVIEWWRWK